MHIGSFRLGIILSDGCYYSPHLTDEETEAQRDR